MNYKQIIDDTVVPAILSYEEKNEKYKSLIQYVNRLLPCKLYRFRTCKERNLDAFYKDELWFSNGSSMNDDFDARLYYDKKKIKNLEYFSVQNPERKRKQAQIYAETGRIREAYKAYEELLFSDFQRSSMELHGMYMLALQDNNRKKARWLADKQKELARCFEMGKYYEISSELEIATIEKDADSVIYVMEEMLSSVEQIGDFRKSILYEHLDFKEVKEDFISNLKENLKKCFQDEENYGFLKDNKRWQKLVNQ